MPNDARPRKGYFGALRLPISGRYLYPTGRNRFLAVSGVLALIFTALLLLNTTVQDGGLISNGPLSSAHASLEVDCAACHTPFQAVGNDTCAVCHERFSDGLGTYSFNAHYVYVSEDRTRAFGRSGEMTCASCHVEHEGREAALTAVSDVRCISCHEFSFSADHPQFDFAAEAIADDQNLTFAHIQHVELVMDERELADHELACLTCHNARPDGALFESVDFDRDCAGCHLGRDMPSEVLEVRPPGTPLVAVQDGQAELSLGVETLATIRGRLGPGEEWALSMSEASFDVGGGLVTKYGIEHRDPWIMHNLRQLRRALYPASELSDLLQASPRIADGSVRRLYEEALGTLRTYAAGLRGQPEIFVQDELTELERVLDEVAARLAASTAPLSATRFRIAAPVSGLTADHISEIEDFAAFVAQPCLQCHRLDQVSIARVQADQQVLQRAKFNHRAHVLQRDCLSCHTEIPFFEYFDVAGAIDPALDSAAIQNLPRIEQCQSCHTSELASDRCMTCHDFHPVKDHLARLAIQ